MPKPTLGDVELQRIRRSAHLAVTPVGEPSAPLPRRKERVIKTHLTGFFTDAVKDQLRMLGIKRRMTIQAQMTEMLNDYFAKHGEPEIAE